MTAWTTANAAPANAALNLMHAETTRQPQFEVGKGGIEVTGSGPIQRSAPAAHTSGQEAPADGSIMATVKSASGGTIIDRSPRGTDIVSIGGMTTTISAAVAAGLLVRNHDGSYADKAAPAALTDQTAEAKAKAPQTKIEEKAEPKGDEFGLPEGAQAALGKLVNNVMPGDTIKAMDSILVNGGVDENTIARMASQAGVEMAEMAEIVNTAHQGFYDVGTRIVEEGGIDMDAFGQFIAADRQRSNKLTEAARAMVMSNDTKGLRALTDSFYEQADRFMPEETRAALTEAGFSWRDTPEGLKVLVNGTPVSFNVAVKQQIVRFTR